MTSRREFLQYSAGAVAAMALPQTAPSPSQDLLPLTVAEAGRRIASKQLSPVELTRQTLARIEALNPKTGAFITVSADQAMDAARVAEREIMQGKYRGPMHGIPFGAKDTYYTKGIRTTAGSYVLRDHYPTFDCTIVRKLKEAGGILVGKTNLPEFSFGGVTPGCHNPWDLARNSGGSSGGSGSALASSMLIAATGGDTSGSIRNPASTNGVVGIKPTFGLVSRYGVVPISWTLDHLGPMARTVEDVAIMLKIIAGPDPMDQFSARVATQDYPQQLKRSIRGLRVGVLSQAEMKGFHTETQKAFLDAVKVLEAQGAQIKEVTFTENTHIAAESHGIIRICEAATYHRQYLHKQETEYRHIWSNDPNDSNTRITVESGMLLTSAQYLKAQQARKLFMQEFYKIYNTLDVFLDPTMPSPADVPAPGAEGYRNWFDLNGFPAVSIPCGFSTNPSGLPIGLQISAKPFQDSLVLAVANAFEQATEWRKRRPSI